MLVVVEGPDGSGKTALIAVMRRHCPSPIVVISRSKPFDSPDDILYFLTWVHIAKAMRGVIVMDRHPAISESLYGPIFRGNSLLSGVHVHPYLRSVDQFIYCRPPTERILANVQRTRHDQMTGVIEKSRELIRDYDDFFAVLHDERYPVSWFDYTRHQLKDLFPDWFKSTPGDTHNDGQTELDLRSPTYGDAEVSRD